MYKCPSCFKSSSDIDRMNSHVERCKGPTVSKKTRATKNISTNSVNDVPVVEKATRNTKNENLQNQVETLKREKEELISDFNKKLTTGETNTKRLSDAIDELQNEISVMQVENKTSITYQLLEKGEHEKEISTLVKQLDQNLEDERSSSKKKELEYANESSVYARKCEEDKDKEIGRIVSSTEDRILKLTNSKIELLEQLKTHETAKEEELAKIANEADDKILALTNDRDSRILDKTKANYTLTSQLKSLETKMAQFAAVFESQILSITKERDALVEERNELLSKAEERILCFTAEKASIHEAEESKFTNMVCSNEKTASSLVQEKEAIQEELNIYIKRDTVRKQELEEARASYDFDLNSMTRDRTFLQELSDSQNEEISVLTNDNSGMREALLVHVEEIKNLTMCNKRVHEEFTELQKHVSSVDSKIVALTKENEALQEELKTYDNKKAVEIKEAVDASKLKIDYIKKEATDLEIKRLLSVNRDHHQAEVERIIASNSNNILTLMTEKADLLEEIKACVDTRDKSVKDALVKTEKANDSCDKRISELEEYNTSVIENYTQKLCEMRKIYTAQTVDLKHHKAQSVMLADQLKSFEDDNLKITSESESSRTNMNTLMAKFQKQCVMKIQDLQDVHTKILSDIDRTHLKSQEEICEGFRKTCSERDDDILKMHNELTMNDEKRHEQLTDNLEKAQKENHKLHAEVFELRKLIDTSSGNMEKINVQRMDQIECMRETIIEHELAISTIDDLEQIKEKIVSDSLSCVEEESESSNAFIFDMDGCMTDNKGGLFPGVADMLQIIKNDWGGTLGVISKKDNSVHKLEKAGVIDLFAYVWEIKTESSIDILTLMCESLGVMRSSCYFFNDSIDIILEAQEAGFGDRAIHTPQGLTWDIINGISK